jgi:hypothetical protein
MHSPRAKAFDLGQEPAAVRNLYGRTKFGDACLLARRLVENGVSFVEVPLGSWTGTAAEVRFRSGRIGSHSGSAGRAVQSEFGDGSVHFISNSIAIPVWMALATRAGGESVGDY